MNEDLLKAYLTTNYIFEDFNLRINENHDAFRKYCEERKISSWAFLTAWNPQSKALSKEDNLMRNFELTEDLANYDYTLGFGKGDDWPAEESFFIPNIDFEKAMTLAQKYDQAAFVYGTHESLPQLILCKDFEL